MKSDFLKIFVPIAIGLIVGYWVCHLLNRVPPLDTSELAAVRDSLTTVRAERHMIQESYDGEVEASIQLRETERVLRARIRRLQGSITQPLRIDESIEDDRLIFDVDSLLRDIHFSTTPTHH